MAYLFFKRRAIRLNVFLLGMNNCLHQDHSRCDRRDWNAEQQSQLERERDTGKKVRAGEMESKCGGEMESERERGEEGLVSHSEGRREEGARARIAHSKYINGKHCHTM